MNKPKDKPVHEVRFGAIKAAIWKNDTANGVRSCARQVLALSG